MHSITRLIRLTLMIAISALVGWSAEGQGIDKTANETHGDSLSQGKPLSYWLRSIRDRDDEIEGAFDAIIDLGPDAWPAVEPLTRFVAEPFVPVGIGVDLTDVLNANCSTCIFAVRPSMR